MSLEEKLGKALLGKTDHVAPQSLPVSSPLTQLDQQVEVMVSLGQLNTLVILTMLHWWQKRGEYNIGGGKKFKGGRLYCIEGRIEGGKEGGRDGGCTVYREGSRERRREGQRL